MGTWSTYDAMLTSKLAVNPSGSMASGSGIAETIAIQLIVHSLQ